MNLEKTRYPGVWRTSDGRYLIRAKERSPKTGKMQATRQLLEAQTAEEASVVRAEWRRWVRGGESQRARVQLAAAATSWLRSKLPALKASTRSRYAEMLDLHILPALGDHYLDAITVDDVIAWRDRQTAAPSTVNGRLRVLRSLLSDVCEIHGLKSPAARVPSIREPRKRRRKSMTAAELATFLEMARREEPEWYPMLLTLALTGARFGEVSALRWEHVDFDAGLIRIEEAQWHQHRDTTKTGATLELPLLPEHAAVLKAHRRRLVASQAKGIESGLVFPSPRAGRCLYTSVLRKPIDRIVSAIERERDRESGTTGTRLRRPHVHGFRHTFNNLARQVAEGEVVRSLTGHLRPEMTRLYSHVEREEQRAATASVYEMVRPKVSEKVSDDNEA